MSAPYKHCRITSVLGLSKLYQLYINNLHNLHAPQNEILKKEKKWNWTETFQEAFQRIKDVLTSELFLTHFDPKVELILAIDASNVIVVVLFQKDKLGGIKAVTHVSRGLITTEKNYSGQCAIGI